MSWGVSGLAQDNECWRHPWLIFKTSLTLRTTVARGPCFVTPAVPNQFRYLVWGKELSYFSLCTHHRLLTKEEIFSPAYCYVVKTGSLLVKCHILWLFMAWVFTYQSVYFYVSDFSWNYNSWVDFSTEVSKFHHTCCKKCDINSEASNILYLFVWQWYAVSIYCPFFKPSFCNSIWSEMNVRQAWNNLCTKNGNFFWQ